MTAGTIQLLYKSKVECLVGWNVVWQSGWLHRWLTVPQMDGRLVVAEMSWFRMNWCHLIFSGCLWHLIWKASRALESVERKDQVSAACYNTNCTKAW